MNEESTRYSCSSDTFEEPLFLPVELSFLKHRITDEYILMLLGFAKEKIVLVSKLETILKFSVRNHRTKLGVFLISRILPFYFHYFVHNYEAISHEERVEMRNQFNHLSRFIDYHEIRSFWNYFVIICEILEVFERSISEEDFTFIEKSMKLADEYNRMIMEYSGSSILKSLSRDVQENVYARVQKAIAAISPPDLVAYEESEFLTIENNGKGAAVNVQLSWFEVNHGDSISITRILPEERYRIYCPAQKIREVLWQDWNEKRYKLVIKGWRRGK